VSGKRANGNRHSKEVIEQAIAAYKRNEPIKVFCYDLGLSAESLHRWLRKRGEPGNRYPNRRTAA